MSVLKISASLRAIINMAHRLDSRALDLANSSLMPGGAAMVNLAHVADLSSWARRNDLAADELASYEDPDELWSPFQMLRYWSEQWRVELGMNYDEPSWYPTIQSEAAFLANPDVLEWAWSHELHFDEFAGDIASARSRLEGILREGERPDRIRVVCPDCDSGKRLIIVYGLDDESDRWKCPECKHKFDGDEVQRAFAKQLRSAGADRWVTLADALSIMQRQGWQEKTVRSWAESDDVDTGRDGQGRIIVYWPDIWRAHLTHRHDRDEAKRVATEREVRKANCLKNHAEGCWEEGHQGKPGRRGCAGMLQKTEAV